MFEYKRGSNILYFTGLCMNLMPRVSYWQKGGFSAFLCARTIPGELRSPILGLAEETFLRHLSVAGILCRQHTRVCEKGFCSILYSCYLCDGEEVFVVFLPHD